MIALLQRVTQSSVTVNDRVIGQIDTGLMVLLGVQKHDTDALCRRLAERVAGYRVFEDEQGKMNLNVQQAGGRILVVPQFTLPADTNKGMRPSFSSAAPPMLGRQQFEGFVAHLRALGVTTETGEFGADMQVALVNDGPVTFWLQV